MKKSLSLFLLFGSLTFATAQSTTNIYTEDWGTVKDPGAPSLAQVGWSYVLPAGVSGGPYEGTFGPVPYEVYFDDMAAGTFGIFYTTDSGGAGTEGDSSFVDINPLNWTNLTFNAVRASGSSTLVSNYFAIQEGGTWYVSTNLLSNTSTASTPYTNLASAWNTLTINAAGSGVTIGTTPGANLSGLITGIGMVASAAPNGWNYGQITVSVLTPPSPPPPVALYAEDWGAGTGGTATTLLAVGWTNINIAYTGFYASAGGFDVTTGVTLSNRAMYLSMDNANNSTAGMVYTTDALGSGTSGDTAFADIDPTQYPFGVTLNLYSDQNGSQGVITNYFAIQVAGAWYVSATPIANNNRVGAPAWTLNSLLYTNNSAAANWNTLTVVAGTSVTVGGPASAPLTGLITGVGVVQVNNGSLTTATGVGVNYLNFTITTPETVPVGPTAPKIDAPGFSQTTFATGTASFAVDATVGSPSPTYTWTFTPTGGSPISITNGANGTGTGAFITGATNNMVTISNVSSADAGTYSVGLVNSSGADYSINYVTSTLTVNPLTNDILYAETFPFVGPFSTDESLTNIGWKSTLASSLDQRGNAYAYTAAAATNAFYTSTNTDVAGLSGVTFPKTGIIPANYPFISFRANIAALAAAGNASVYWAVQMAGGKWYSSSSALTLGAGPANFNTYGLQFSTNASQWNSLTLNASSAVIGSVATANLSGNITGAGVVFGFTGGSLYAINSFMVVTDSTPPVPPSFTSEPNVPYPQTVYIGGGVGFNFVTAGTVPITNSWEFDDSSGSFQSGTVLVNGTNGDGSVISGATNNLLLLQNVQTAEAGIYSGWAQNGGGTNSTDTSTYGSPPLTVLTPPVGLIYSESFPVYSLPAGNISLTNVGWTLQADTPTRLFKLTGSTADTQSGTLAAYAYEGGVTNSVLYASTTTDTGYSGLPFIAFDPANYPGATIQFSTAMAQGNASLWTNVTASIAVQQGGKWYAMTGTPFLTASATPAITIATGGNVGAAYTPIGPITYNPNAAQWQTLTFTNTAGVLVGGTPSQNLSGPITAAGILFQHFGSGGSVDFNSYTIQATGSVSLIGGINTSPVSTNGTVTLSWIGNPSVRVQSSTDLKNWTGVPNTAGQHSLTVPATGTHVFYSLISP